MNNINLITTIISSVFFVILLFIFAISISLRYRKRKRENEDLKVQFSQTLLQSQLEIREQTLRHISYELHDNLGQVASLIKINLNTFQFDDKTKAIQKIADTKELTLQLIADIKALSVSVGSDHLSRTGILKALEMEVERLNKTGEFIASFRSEVEVMEISQDRAVILYRMVQEILNNCIKHSRAKHIDLIIHNQENKYILAINDDGVGFNTEKAGSNVSAGLTNLQNRAQLIQANIKIDSTPGKGTQVTISLFL